MKIVLFVDGENFKSKIKSILKAEGISDLIWHEDDFKRLFEKALEGVEINEVCFYFARIKDHPQSSEKSKQLIEEQRLLKTYLETCGFKVIMAGSVSGSIDKIGALIFKEKGVDVRIGIDMVVLACDKKVNLIILSSSDSDLQPAIKEFSDRGVECIYLGFEMQPNKGITYTTTRTILIRNSEVVVCRSRENTLKI